MGGGFVLLLAAQQGDRVGAAVPFYGVGPAVPEQYAGLTAAVQGHYAEQDDFYPVAAGARAGGADPRASPAPTSSSSTTPPGTPSTTTRT